MGLTWEEARGIFGEYVTYYFCGQTTLAFLSALADELLLVLTKHNSGQQNSQLFDVLLAVSMAPSVFSPQERTHYLKTLGQLYGS